MSPQSNIDLITIDHGNTNPHVGFFTKGELTKTLALKDVDQQLLKENYVVLSSVGKKNDIPNLPLKIDIESLWKDHRFASMNVDYHKESLGRDRLYQAAYLYDLKVLKNKKPALLIDAGTFITVDLITEKGYQGGIILPGLSKLSSLYPQAENLPLIEASKFLENKENYHDTESAIVGGVQNMILGAIKTMSVEDQEIYLTGGLSIFLEKWLEVRPKDFNIVEKEAHLIHKALHYLAMKSLAQNGVKLQ